jgi:hypothetical protein
MPDWIDNTITLTGTPVEIKALFDSGFDFEKLFPAPAEITDNNQIVDWHYQYWGTKWAADVEEIQYEPGSTTMKISCRTANGAPYGLLAYLSRESPTLRIQHVCEQGNGMVLGHVSYTGGILNGGEFYPGMYSAAALRTFAATNPWFHAENFITMMREFGYPDVEGTEEVALRPICATYEECVAA